MRIVVIPEDVVAASIAAVRKNAGEGRAERYARAIAEGRTGLDLLGLLCGKEDPPEEVEARAVRVREIAAMAEQRVGGKP